MTGAAVSWRLETGDWRRALVLPRQPRNHPVSPPAGPVGQTARRGKEQRRPSLQVFGAPGPLLRAAGARGPWRASRTSTRPLGCYSLCGLHVFHTPQSSQRSAAQWHAWKLAPTLSFQPLDSALALHMPCCLPSPLASSLACCSLSLLSCVKHAHLRCPCPHPCPHVQL